MAKVHWFVDWQLLDPRLKLTQGSKKQGGIDEKSK